MNKGFSLVELLVVITIVGIIAAISIPAYQRYTERTQLAAAVNVMYSYIDKSKIYYGKTGVFPTLQELGEPTDSGNPSQAATTFPPNSLDDYFMQPNIITILVSRVDENVYTCGGGIVVGYLSNFRGGAATATDNTPAVANVQIGYTDYNNTLPTACVYYIQEDSQMLSGDYIPNCVNLADNPNAFEDYFEALFNSC